MERWPVICGIPPLLSKGAHSTLSDIFTRFSTGENETMTKHDLKHYIMACGAGENSYADHRIKGLCERFGTRPDRSLSLSLSLSFCFFAFPFFLFFVGSLSGKEEKKNK